MLHTFVCFFNSKWGQKDNHDEASLREMWHVVWPKEDWVLFNYFTTGGIQGTNRGAGKSICPKVPKKTGGQYIPVSFLA